jgi:hypothetical protein
MSLVNDTNSTIQETIEQQLPTKSQTTPNNNSTTIVITMNTTIIERALHHLFNEGKFIENIWLYTSGVTTFFMLILVLCIKNLLKKCQRKSEETSLENEMSEINDLLGQNVWNMKKIKRGEPYNTTIHRKLENNEIE